MIHHLRRNCSDNVPGDKLFEDQAVEYKSYLLKSKYEEDDIDKQFIKILSYNRKSMLRGTKKKRKKNLGSVKFITDFTPTFPNIKKRIKELEPTIQSDPLLQKMFPNGANSIQIIHKRGGKNIKELLAPSSINVNRIERNLQSGSSGPCDGNCRHCDHLRETACTSFTSNVTGRRYQIRQHMNCKSTNVVYLVTCKRCGWQGVGSTTETDPRLANYWSHIKHKHRFCRISQHFIDKEDHSIAHFSFCLIAQVQNKPKQKATLMKRLREFEGYWQIELGTLEPYGMNSINEFHKSEKYPTTKAYELNEGLT